MSPTAPRQLRDAELDFLIICTHRQIPDELRQRAYDIWAGGLDLDRLYHLARKHQLRMLLYRGLLQLGITSPLGIRLADEITSQTVLYEFVYPQQLAHLLAELEAAQIETLLLKGHALGTRVYGQPALRPYSDFDILIPLDQSAAAIGVLADLGYAPDDSDDYPADYHLHHHHFVPFVHTEWLPVELHWRLVTPLGGTRVDLAAVWADARRVDILGARTRVLSPEHLLIYLALHGVGTHLLDVGLKALCDVAEVIAASELDWEKVMAACHTWGCARQVYLMLRLVVEFYGEIVPAGALHRLCPQGVAPALLRYSLSNVLNTAVAGLEKSSGLAQVWQTPNPTRRWQLIVSRLFPTPEEIADRYQLDWHDWRRWLYYPRWQAALLRRHWRTGLRLLRADPAMLEQARQETVRQDLLAWIAAESVP